MAGGLRPCRGCDALVDGFGYCPTCRRRLRDSTPLDLESYPPAPGLERRRRRRLLELACAGGKR